MTMTKLEKKLVEENSRLKVQQENLERKLEHYKDKARVLESKNFKLMQESNNG